MSQTPPQESDSLAVSNNWIRQWMKKSCCSLRKEKTRIEWSELRIWKCLSENFDIEIPVINGDQMPLHRNEPMLRRRKALLIKTRL